jgi:hypothetical protein
LHVDRYLQAFVENYGMWVYALPFLIIFVETGLVVVPFLPVIPCFLWWAPCAVVASRPTCPWSWACRLSLQFRRPGQLPHWQLLWAQGVSMGKLALF